MPTDFTPVSALLGGALIGIAATLLYAGIGRIAGISGLLNNAIEQAEGRGWRLAFLIGMVAAAASPRADRRTGSTCAGAPTRHRAPRWPVHRS